MRLPQSVAIAVPSGATSQVMPLLPQKTNWYVQPRRPPMGEGIAAQRDAFVRVRIASLPNIVAGCSSVSTTGSTPLTGRPTSEVREETTGMTALRNTAVRDRPLRIMLIEDQEREALVVGGLLADSAQPVELFWVTSVVDARRRWDIRPDCVLLDVDLPDSDGPSSLREVQRIGECAVIMLAGSQDGSSGLAELAAGAQDYLRFTDGLDGHALHRAIVYAVQRHQVERANRGGAQADVGVAESVLLTRRLLTAPILADPGVAVHAAHLPGDNRLLLGGDFYDAVESADGTVRVVIGDVCGQGPDEAALGVALRMAWRTLVLAGHPDSDILPRLQQILIRQRDKPYLFATVAMASIEKNRRHATLWSAGHPPPLLRTGGRGWIACAGPTQIPLGLDPEQTWAGLPILLGTDWVLLLYTDGLIMDRDAGQAEMMWVDGLLDTVRAGHPPVGALDGARLVEDLMTLARRRGSASNDDVAALVVHAHPVPELDGTPGES